jgi:hypothetical protein
MPKRQAERVFYTASQALSVAAATASDLYKFGMPTSITIATISASLEGLKAYNFQGASIQESDVTSPDYIIINVEQSETTPLLQKTYYESWQHYFTEIGLNTVSASFTIANRYFLVTSLFGLFGLPLSASVIWPIILSDTAFKMLFDLTNELYETNAALATLMNNGVGAKPIYAGWRIFRSIAGSAVARDTLAIIGTLEHSIVDDILPWLLFVPQSSITKLANAYKNFNAASALMQAFAVLTPIVGGFIALLIIFQTMTYETEHSFEAYASILNQKAGWVKSLFARVPLNKGFLSFLQYAAWLMPFCHGAAAAAPVYSWMKKLFSLENDGVFSQPSMRNILTSIGTVITTLFTFSGTAIGHYHSEFRESQELLVDRITELEEVVVTR